MKKFPQGQKKRNSMIHFSFRALYWVSAVIIAGITLPGCATAPVSTGSSEQDVVLKDLCVRYGISCAVDSNSQVITIQRDNFQAKAMVGSDVVMVDNDKLTLSSPVRLSRGVVYVPADFKMKVISPIFKKASSAAGAYKILIDAGHGGHDPGGIGSLGTKEKDVVLDIAKRLKINLEDRGFVVDMTRDTDQFLELEERADLANQQGVGVLVSIHANIAKARKVKGLEVYSLRSLDAKETKEAVDPEKYRRSFADYQMKKNDLALKKTLIDMLRDYKDSHSDRLARCLSREVSSALDLDHRGDKQAGFYVLKYTLVPSVLVEVGFLSNRSEEKNLQSGAYRQKIADGIAESLSRYVHNYVQ